MDTIFKKARKFVYQNARPIDLARWQYHFEGGSKDAVVQALSAYQNGDGGFGHGLEPDFWNPDSSPMQTWAATERLFEIGFDDAEHPIVAGILQYLESGAAFETMHNQWLNCIPTNNDYPHAIWWTYQKEGGYFMFNPTACLAGFALRFSSPKRALYRKAGTIAKQAAEFFIDRVPFAEQHVTTCFVRLFQYCAHFPKLFNREKLRQKLLEQVHFNICKDPEKWFLEYVPKPSEFVLQDEIFIKGNENLIQAECRLLRSFQQPDGSYPLPVQWGTVYKESAIAENWWKSHMIIQNFLFLRRFDSEGIEWS